MSTTIKVTIEQEQAQHTTDKHGGIAQGPPHTTEGQGSEPIRTKKATTIMPKEVFNALQRYCTESDTPKHRAIYLFIIDGLHAAAAINGDEYKRFRDMAVLLTTTYEKKA